MPHVFSFKIFLASGLSMSGVSLCSGVLSSCCRVVSSQALLPYPRLVTEHSHLSEKIAYIRHVGESRSVCFMRTESMKW